MHLYAPKLAEVLLELEELLEKDEDRYIEIPVSQYCMLTEKALLVKIDPQLFRKEIPDNIKFEPVWFPLSKLKQLDGVVYFHSWLAKEKGLNI